jgi:formate hydrogenlyase transcriptional activator
LRDVASLRRQLQEHGRFGQMVGNAPALRSVYRVIEQAAPTAASVLVYGESGTGKELVAKTIHQLSGRSRHPFIAINCAAIPESLLENEIFGHERGAFTGALDRRPGCFELAHTGTLFLDEIAEVSPGIQAKLLRVLQERTIRRLGGQKEQAVDVRLIAATNVDPTKAVHQGKLREDLYYRINVIGICVPPLRERIEDIPLLVETFITEFNERNGKSVKAMSPEAMRVLQRYSWPGNIRELRNVVERAMISAPSRRLTIPSPQSSATLTRRSPRLIDVEKEHIRTVLEGNGWRIRGAGGAADKLGLKPTTLETRMAKLGLKRPGRS